MKLQNRGYDALKEFALVWLPAIGTLYFTLASIWSLPNAEKVVGSIVAFDTLLGAILHISSRNYKPPTDGQIYLGPNKGKYTFNMDTPLENFKSGNVVMLDVKTGPAPGPALVPDEVPDEVPPPPTAA